MNLIFDHLVRWLAPSLSFTCEEAWKAKGNTSSIHLEDFLKASQDFKNNNIVVTNTPEVLTDCTADIAMLLMLGVARRGSEGEFHIRKKEWSGWRPTHMMGTKVTGKTLGLIGMGRIAQAMAHKSHFGFNMKIIFFDPYFDNDEVMKKFEATKLNSIDEVLSQADFVSLHCPSTKETKGLINKETISKMKKSAYLINTARGDIVNEKDLVEIQKDIQNKLIIKKVEFAKEVLDLALDGKISKINKKLDWRHLVTESMKPKNQQNQEKTFVN